MHLSAVAQMQLRSECACVLLSDHAYCCSLAEVKQKKPRKPKQAKEPREKRTNEYGATVRYAAQPSQSVYQRIQRALPGALRGCGAA
jgi:hypothetical protein